MRVLGRPYGPKPHNGLLNRYEGTNITEENVVNHPRTQLIDALIESCAGPRPCLVKVTY